MKCSVKSIFRKGGIALVAFVVVAYYSLIQRWKISVAYPWKNELSIEEINERWSWSEFDAEKASLENAHLPYYTEEELTPWINKPMHSFPYPGKFGKPYEAENITAEEQKRLDEGWHKYEFNELVCSKIPLHRYLGDDREEACKARKWKRPMGKASVVIIFYNEAWCTLLRTIFSVLETSPKILLKEIILIDDVSTYGDLGTKLEEFVKQLKIVRLIRMKERVGIAPTRTRGARESTGDVVVFLDAHCECTKGWLEPMLERIAEEPKALVTPVIEDMPYDTFSMKFRKSKFVPIGVTNWDLGFGWGGQRNRPRDKPPDALIKSPVVVGVSAIKRSYFFEIGGFDEELKFWGAEQLEISFKVWLCGGTLEIHPCSHVGHMHRRGFQYNDFGDAIARNNRRVAEVWMGEYKEQFLKRLPKARFIDPGDLSKQFALKERLHCKDFSWFLENLHPDMYAVPKNDVMYWGQIATRTDMSAECFDSGFDVYKPVILYPCHGKSGHQLFMYTRQGEIRLNAEREWCMIPKDNDVVFQACIFPNGEVPTLQKWQYIEINTDFKENSTKRGHFRHSSGRCLQKVDATTLKLKPCVNGQEQLWYFRDMPSEPGYLP